MGGTVRPTKKQQELLVYIEQFIGEHGYSPSYREIMNGCQYTSVATVALHVGNLIKRGHLRKRDHSARSIEVVKNPESSATAGVSLTEKPGNEVENGGGWLIQQTEHLIAQAEQQSTLSKSAVEDIRILIKACSIVGLQSQAAVLMSRFENLGQ
jgi:SOS-response transcriptional repressor LexA